MTAKLERLKKQYEEMHKLGHLSEKGMDYYILILKKKVNDYQEQIQASLKQ